MIRVADYDGEMLLKTVTPDAPDAPDVYSFSLQLYDENDDLLEQVTRFTLPALDENGMRAVHAVMCALAGALRHIQRPRVLGMMLDGRIVQLTEELKHVLRIGTIVAFEKAGKRTDHRTFVVIEVDRMTGVAKLDLEPDAKPGATMVKA